MIHTAALQSDWVGRRIDGKFPLLEWLGSNESSAVFRTQIEGSTVQRAVIGLLSADAGDAQAQLDSWAEGETFSHPHLMRIFHVGRTHIDQDELLYVVTEYAEESLSQLLPQRALTPAEAREMLEPVLDALSYVHDRGMVWGDLTPQKITVVADRVRLPIDGLRRAGNVRIPHAAWDIHDAPETATGGVSKEGDIWSLGVTLVEALTQRPPAWDRAANKDPVVPDSLPTPFAEIAQKCLRTDPASRGTLGEIQALLHPPRATRRDPR